MDTLVSENLIRLRKKAKLSQQRLAELADVTRQSISNYEKSRTSPDSKVLARLAEALNVEVSTLLQKNSPSASTNSRFRADKSFSAEADVQEKANLYNQQYCELEKYLGYEPYTPSQLPCHDLDLGKIQQICTDFRQQFELGDKPIFNLFEVVEKKGLKVLRMSIDIPRFFGLSLFTQEGGAFVLINKNVTIERQLFTLAHEIGHLICHRDEYDGLFKGEGNILEEKIADWFASYLLVPQREFDLLLTQTEDIRQLKSYFNVSYQVILKRLSEMGKVDYGRMQARICSSYKREYGQSLKRTMELPPALQKERFPENRRMAGLIDECCSSGKISSIYADSLRQNYSIGLDSFLSGAYSFID